MGWDRGRYYSRSTKVNGRVVREYFGAGPLGQLAAQLDAQKRQQREAQRAAWEAEQAELRALEDPVRQLDELAQLVARAALVVAGFRQHHRGDWRKHRGQHHQTR